MEYELQTTSSDYLVKPLLNACAAPYVAPTSGPRATIRYVNDAQHNLKISYYEISSGCKRRRFTEMILPATEASHNVYADSELTFQYYLTYKMSGGREKYCLMNLRFLPTAGSSYVFRTSEDANSCQWSMIDNTSEAGVVPIKLTVVPWKRGFDDNSSWCDQ